MAEQVSGFGLFSNRFPAKAAQQAQGQDPSLRQAKETMAFSTGTLPGSVPSQTVPRGETSVITTPQKGTPQCWTKS